MGILSRLPRVGQLFEILEHVNLDEFGEALVAVKDFRARIGTLDVSSAESVGSLIDSGINALRQAVDVTKTEADDAVVEFFAKPVEEYRSILVAAIQWLASRPNATQGEFVVAMFAMYPQSSKLSTILDIALEIWSLIRAFKNRAN